MFIKKDCSPRGPGFPFGPGSAPSKPERGNFGTSYMWLMSLYTYKIHSAWSISLGQQKKVQLSHFQNMWKNIHSARAASRAGKDGSVTNYFMQIKTSGCKRMSKLYLALPFLLRAQESHHALGHPSYPLVQGVLGILEDLKKESTSQRED